MKLLLAQERVLLSAVETGLMFMPWATSISLLRFMLYFKFLKSLKTKGVPAAVTHETPPLGLHKCCILLLVGDMRGDMGVTSLVWDGSRRRTISP